MIPELVDNVLPEGLHDCTMEEVSAAFGRFWRSDRRIGLTIKLRQFVEEARKSGIVAAVIVDGSYVTGKAEPDDIDVIVVLKSGIDLTHELTPQEYKVQSKRLIKADYRFDALVAEEGTPRYHEYVKFFAQVRPDDPTQASTRTRKGLLRIAL